MAQRRATGATGRTFRRPGPAILAVAWAMLALAVATTPTVGQGDRPTVHVAEITGVINPLSAEYLVRSISDAHQAGAGTLVVRMDTPGGLDSAMRTMIQAILDSPVPVVVYVAPSGGRAASAGLFITMAAHVAAMAPGTSIGAAHPVALGGDGADETAIAKATNDAAAYIRSIAAARNRNADWAERAVRESVSASAEEAVALNVVDLLATDQDALLQSLDGRQVRTRAGETTLQTAAARVVPAPMTLPERILHAIADPNIALLLLTIGTIGIIAELYSPGTWIPGTVGAISLILAFAALGNMPTNWAGVALVLLAVILLMAELQNPGFGIFGAGAAVSFVLGGLFLFRPFGGISPAAPTLTVSPALIAGLGLGAGLFAVFVLRELARVQRAPASTGPEALVGAFGIAETELAPAGVVRTQSERWTATAEDGTIPAGRAVQVVRVEGVTLIVRAVEGDQGEASARVVSSP